MEEDSGVTLTKIISSLPGNDELIDIDIGDDDDEVHISSSPSLFAHSHAHRDHRDQNDSKDDNDHESDISIPRIEKKYDLQVLLSMLESKAGAVRKRMNSLHEELLRYEDFIFHIKKIHEKHRASRSNVRSLIEQAHMELCEVDEESKLQDRLIDLNSQWENQLEDDARDFTDSCDRAVRETQRRFDTFGDGIIELQRSNFNPLDRIDNIHARSTHEKLESLSKNIDNLIKEHKKEAKQLKKIKQQRIETCGKKEKEKEKKEESRVMQSPPSHREHISKADIVKDLEDMPTSPPPRNKQMKIDSRINQEDEECEEEETETRSPKRQRHGSEAFAECSDTPENLVAAVVEKNKRSEEEKDNHDDSSETYTETTEKAEKIKTPSKKKSSGRKPKKEEEELHEPLQAGTSSSRKGRKKPESEIFDLSNE